MLSMVLIPQVLPSITPRMATSSILVALTPCGSNEILPVQQAIVHTVQGGRGCMSAHVVGIVAAELQIIIDKPDGGIKQWDEEV